MVKLKNKRSVKRGAFSTNPSSSHEDAGKEATEQDDSGTQSSSLLSSENNLSLFIHKFGHEIGNPLTSIISLSSIIEKFAEQSESKPLDTEKIARYAASIQAEAWRISKLNETCVFLATNRSPLLSPCCLQDLISKSLSRLASRDQLSFEPTQLELSIPDSLEILSEREQLSFVISELLKNAHTAANGFEEKEKTNIKIYAVEKDDVVDLIIENKFHGPIEGTLESIFELLVSYFPDTSRSGFGLPTIEAILSRMNASLTIEEFESNLEYQFIATVRLPSAKEQAVAPLPAESRQVPAPLSDLENSESEASRPLKTADSSTNKLMLIVEDEATVASAVKRILDNQLCEQKVEVHVVGGDEAIEIISSNADISAILCDLNLDGISGRYVFEEFIKNRSSKRFAFMTGEQIRIETRKYLDSVPCPCLMKPFEAEQLIEIALKLLKN